MHVRKRLLKSASSCVPSGQSTELSSVARQHGF